MDCPPTCCWGGIWRQRQPTKSRANVPGHPLVVLQSPRYPPVSNHSLPDKCFQGRQGHWNVAVPAKTIRNRWLALQNITQTTWRWIWKKSCWQISMQKLKMTAQDRSQESLFLCMTSFSRAMMPPFSVFNRHCHWTSVDPGVKLWVALSLFPEQVCSLLRWTLKSLLASLLKPCRCQKHKPWWEASKWTSGQSWKFDKS